MAKKIRVIIVDDSAFIRRVYKDILETDPDIEVVGAAEEPYEARELIKQLNPDVITLDIEMPKMDGLSFLEKIMTLRPMPVVMSSSLTQEGAEATLRAMELGAVEILGKPLEGQHAVVNLHKELIQKVKTASKATVRPLRKTLADRKITVKGKPKNVLIALGASTGGVEAVTQLLSHLPKEMPPIILTQHMPANFTKSFAKRLDGNCPLSVREAVPGDVVKPGEVCVAPGDRHMKVQKMMGSQVSVKLSDEPEMSGHKPSVDMMFKSVAEKVGSKAIGIIMTGMGKDGAKGLLDMREGGAKTYGQSKASCVVYGMPKAAMMVGATEEELSLDLLSKKLVELSFSS